MSNEHTKPSESLSGNVTNDRTPQFRHEINIYNEFVYLGIRTSICTNISFFWADEFYSQDLINNLFFHPYTKIEFVMRDLEISRNTASKYLDALCDDGLLKKQKIVTTNYYINTALYGILTKEL